MIGPAPPPIFKEKQEKVFENSLPNNDFSDLSQENTELLENKSCIIGPSLPEEFLKTKRKESVECSEKAYFHEEIDKNECFIGPLPDFEQTENEDEIGPRPCDFIEPVSLDKRKEQRDAAFKEIQQRCSNQVLEIPITTQEKKRDNWMVVPPSYMDLNSRVSSNLKARSFSTGKSAQLSNFNIQNTNLWTESYEDKQKRLKQEAIGVDESMCKNNKAKKELSTIFNMKKQKTNSEVKHPSLYEMHLKLNKEHIDDPSKRMFDREKDILGENCMSFSKRQKILNFSKDMSRFSSGSYL
ncbi:hypothetical protein PORY_000132 [Pneumocystis oryctolagi]|uniref:Uncharacterized protein n=1 Tax=Pneumocystis oryctolagi TaxID=42067 RepID=A0ACB7CEF2_9ASCO|nr:hypothetical protein PORY_000132 [Pneumocystis oryctolagi]